MLDAGLIGAALYWASDALEHEWSGLLSLAAILAIAVFLLVGEARHLYASWRLATFDDEFKAVFTIWGVACCAVIVGAFLAKVLSIYSRLAMVIWFLITPALLLASRLAVRGLLHWFRSAVWHASLSGYIE